MPVATLVAVAAPRGEMRVMAVSRFDAVAMWIAESPFYLPAFADRFLVGSKEASAGV